MIELFFCAVTANGQLWAIGRDGRVYKQRQTVFNNSIVNTDRTTSDECPGRNSIDEFVIL
jgi:hypothetical protein